MRTWSRLAGPIAKPCGRCGQPIAVGAPHLSITGPETRWVLRRCVTCAGEPVPPSVAPLPDATTIYADEHRDALAMGTLQMDVNEPRRRWRPSLGHGLERKSG